jgi:formylglycine-generating enzyme required for sulfatase activity
MDAEAPTERRPRAATPPNGVALRAVSATLPSARPRPRAAGRTIAAVLVACTAAAVYVGYPRLPLLLRHRCVASVPAPAPAPTAVPTKAPAAEPEPATATAPAAPAITACPAGMLLVPDSRFFMGSDDGPPESRPAHAVRVGAFCIDRFEVTTADYKACSDHGACKRAAEVNAWAGIASSDHEAFDPLCNARDARARGKHPINCVDWTMAAGYCAAHGARLPTEAEWELAARGPDGRAYPWGDDAPSPRVLNACGRECAYWGLMHRTPETPLFGDGDAFATTAPVGSFPAGKSPFGMEDAAGNVWEWVADAFGAYDGSRTTGERVIRGGAWNASDAAWVSATFRASALPETKSYGIGFRCAL